jgi:hypothetical protein
MDQRLRYVARRLEGEQMAELSRVRYLAQDHELGVETYRSQE